MSAALLLALATATNAPAPASLVVRGDRLFIAARFNGVATEAVLDSAAESSFVDDEFADRIGASGGQPVTARGSGGAAEARLVPDVTVEAAGLKLAPTAIGVTDLDGVGARLFGHRLDAIVGRELFDAARIAIDIEGRSLRVLPRNAAPAGRKLRLAGHHGVETVPVSIEGGPPVRAEFDLGNGSDVLLGQDYASRRGLLDPARIVGTDSGGGVGGATTRPVVILSSLTIAGVTFRNVRAAISNQPNAADANIGVKLLRHFRIVSDFSRNAVWLQPRPVRD